MKPIIVIAGTGTIDKCGHCKKEYLLGNACFIVDGWISINICNRCLKFYKQKINEHKI